MFSRFSHAANFRYPSVILSIGCPFIFRSLKFSANRSKLILCLIRDAGKFSNGFKGMQSISYTKRSIIEKHEWSKCLKIKNKEKHRGHSGSSLFLAVYLAKKTVTNEKQMQSAKKS